MKREFIDVGAACEFELGRPRLVTVAGREIGVYRLTEGFAAVRNFCPHRGAPICRGPVGGTMIPSAPGSLEWGLEGVVVQCPWHRWEFDLRTGESLFNVDKRRLITYEVVERAGRVLLRLRQGDLKRLLSSSAEEEQ